MAFLTDTHCHLYLPQFDHDRQSVIEQAIDSGLQKILVPGIDIRTSEQAINLCALYPKVLFAAIGIHPNSKYDFNERSMEQLNTLAKSEYVVAIGEIGLDYYRLVNPIDQQKMMFQFQLELASLLDLPVCIHNRNASEDAIDLVEKWQDISQTRNSKSISFGVFHSFNESLEISKRILDLGFLIGITGPITYPGNHELRKVISKTSIDKILIETDSPYLTPQQFRGQRNLPFYVKFIAQQLSEIYQLDFEKVKDITSINAENLFRWQ